VAGTTYGSRNYFHWNRNNDHGHWYHDYCWNRNDDHGH
jgi:hypothetical protein